MIHVWSVWKYRDDLVSYCSFILKFQLLCWGERTGCLVISDGVREYLGQI